MRQIKHRTKGQAKEAYETMPNSGNREDIINWLLLTDFIDNYVLKLMYNSEYDNKEDIILDIWLIVLDIDLNKWDELFKQGSLHIILYVSGIIYRQINSTTSEIFRKYKNYNTHFVNLSDIAWTIFDKTNLMPNI